MYTNSTDDATRRIKRTAQQRLTAHGPEGLDMAAIADAAGVDAAEMQSLFPGRDDLLTAMILDAYNGMGEQAEAGAREAAAHGATPLERWVATCRQARIWARAHPAEYALIWGPPLPGYRAPPETMIAGARTALALIGILQQTHSQNGLVTPGVDQPLSPGMRACVDMMANGMLVGLPDDVIARMLVAWTQVLGALSFAVYGHVQGFAADPDAFFDHAAGDMGRYVGLTN
jgi:AcrR family transcriptional regulator